MNQPFVTGLEWTDIPRTHQLSGYWEVIPKDSDSCLDGNKTEIVYVYFDGKMTVLRLGETRKVALTEFKWIRMIHLNSDS